MSQGAAPRPRDSDSRLEPPPPEREGLARTPELPMGRTVLALCVDDQHEVWAGRVRVRWEGAGEGEAWIPTLRGMVVREGDRVLLTFPANADEPVVCGVVDGLRRRNDPPATPAARLELRPDECIRVDSEDGNPLLEVSRGEEGPVVRLLDEDVLLSVDGRFALRARTIDLEAREGEVRVRAAEDVVIQGEIVRLN